ncbi:3D domain-containing protein [Oceanobacillus massiliensis]|uniref:3D domain-containing protein n=1 Tax=Oceanobacillus massiliensis TaxID=1465765 RepID=UPI000287E3E6|nr:3D domain-containing protein [Oceanobacillus massiliensis]
MRKLVAAIAAGIIIAGTAATSVSAEEHEVKQGENLWKIADEYNTTVEELININDLKDTVIHPKDLLYINDTYAVKRGDTLIDISKEYDITVEELREWNDLKTDLIVIGQELYIKGVNVKEEDAKPAEKAEKKQEKQGTESAAKVKTESASDSEQAPKGKTISVSATAYTAKCDGCSGITYTGIDLNKNPNAKVIAVDPNVIPLGSEVYVEGYGYATAADIGGAIKGNEIDIHVPTDKEAVSYGIQTIDVTIVE